MQPRKTDISHFRAPYKDAYFSGFGDPALDAVSTVDPVTGVRVLTPAGALALTTFLQGFGFTVLTTAPDKEQILVSATAPTAAVVGSGSSLAAVGTAAMDWVNAELALGRSVIVSTNAPGGIPALFSGGAGVPAVSGQVVLAAVSNQTDELAGAGAATGGALIMPSKLTASGLPVLASSGLMGPIGIAILALAVVGGAYYVFGRKKTGFSRR